MPIVLIEPDASLRALLHCLVAQSEAQVTDFATPAAALTFIQTAPMVVTILSVNAEAGVLHLLKENAALHLPVFVPLPPGIIVHLLRTQQRLEGLLGAMHVAATGPTIHTDVTAAQWSQIVAFLPAQDSIGRPWADQRDCLNGMLWVVRTGSAWHQMPKQYGSYVTCWRRWHSWQRDGTWQRIEELLAS